MKPIRILALGLIGAFIASQWKHQGTQQRVISLADRFDRLLPARAGAPSSPRQSRIASADTRLPDYTPEPPNPSRRQPANTPASQQLGIQ